MGYVELCALQSARTVSIDTLLNVAGQSVKLVAVNTPISVMSRDAFATSGSAGLVEIE